jgi:hypothetical protein
MRLTIKDYDKLKDIDKVKINSFISAKGINTLLIMSFVSCLLSLNNILEFNVFASFIFFILSAWTLVNYFSEKDKMIKMIEDKYFKVEVKN